MYTLCRNINHGESVYNAIQIPDCHIMKPPMYRSRYSNMVKSESCCQKTGCFRTMGLPQVCLCPPENYLRKQSRVPISVRPAAVPRVKFASSDAANQVCESKPDGAGDAPTQTQECDGAPAQSGDCNQGGTEECQVNVVMARARVPRLCCNRQKPSIPSPCQGFAVIQRGKKDYVMDNALKVIRQPGKVPQSFYVDHPKGHRFEWGVSGYPRKYVCRQDFGMIPGYLVNRKRELYEADQKAKCEAENADMAAQAKCRHLDEVERQSMINGLKMNWAETYREYQSLPLYIDTEGLVKRKSALEAELKDLEKDIQLMERHNHVFVADTPKSFYL